MAAEPVRSELHVMYVPQGFEAIDQGVIGALSKAVHLSVAPQHEMLAYAERYAPDIVLVMNGLHTFPADQPAQIEAIRRRGIRTAIWFVDDPYVSEDSAMIAPHYDVVFTHERACVPRYVELGCRAVYHLPLAAHEEMFHPMQVEQQYRTDICFIGVAFWNRVRLFDQIAPYLKHKKVLIAGSLWQRMERYSDVAPSVRDGWIEVPETVKYYNGAKIVLNIHRTPEPLSDNKNSRHWQAESINPRTFEIASCGTLQLTDERPELANSYGIGKEMVTFQTADQLIEQMEYYLKNEEERLDVAARSYKRTREQHSFGSRIAVLLDTIERSAR